MDLFNFSRVCCGYGAGIYSRVCCECGAGIFSRVKREYGAEIYSRVNYAYGARLSRLSDETGVSPGVSRGNGWISLLGMLAATVIILFLAWAASRWIAQRGGASGFGGTEEFRILYQLPLGRTERLVILRAGTRCYLLGVTEANITLLKEWDGEEAEAWTSALSGSDLNFPFSFSIPFQVPFQDRFQSQSKSQSRDFTRIFRDLKRRENNNNNNNNNQDKK